MTRYIIIKTQDVQCLIPKNPITEVDDIAVTDADGVLIIFNSFDEAADYQDDNAINGQCVELPLY